MISNKLVSVIIPTYNNSKYIMQSIESVLEQTYKDIEIIVIDDGSTDNTKDKLMNLVENNLITYIYQINKGASSARNRGIDNANGEYIAFLDSDDYWPTNKIQIQLFSLYKNNANLSITNGITVNEVGDYLFRIENKFSNDNKKVIKNIFFGKIKSIMPTLLVEKRCIDILNLRFNEKLKHKEDALFIMELINKYKLDYINKPLFFRREHQYSLRTTLNYKSFFYINYSFFILVQQKFSYLKKDRHYFLSELYYVSSKILYSHANYKESLKYIKKSLKYNIFNYKNYLLYPLIFFKIDFTIVKSVLRYFKQYKGNKYD